MHLGSCGACKMAWICDCAGGREETTWWTCSVLALFFSYVYMFHWSFSENILCLCSGYVLQFLSIWLRCALRWVIRPTPESSWPIPICKCCSVQTICSIPHTTDAWRLYFWCVSSACRGEVWFHCLKKIWSFCIWGLATEALEKENLLWRTRPKYHK